MPAPKEGPAAAEPQILDYLRSLGTTIIYLDESPRRAAEVETETARMTRKPARKAATEASHAEGAEPDAKDQGRDHRPPQCRQVDSAERADGHRAGHRLADRRDHARCRR